MSHVPRHHDTYISRREEAEIYRQVDLVRADRVSRVVLVYGSGGVGKTQMVRAMAAREGANGGDVIWIRPIDVDDSVYWLLANLGSAVARQIDPDRQYFKSYFEYASKLPQYTRQRIERETVVSHFGRAKQEFLECYGRFIEGTGHTVVITLDTVEAIRSMYLLLTVTQWMKALPGTLFVMAGRPASSPEEDPILAQLDDRRHPMKRTEIRLGGFDREETFQYLDQSDLSSSLVAADRRRLFELTEGHPLWLALALDFLRQSDPPSEMAESTVPGSQLREAFRRRLIAPYRSIEFWPEAIKRLAVVRHSVNEHVWRGLMADRDLPDDIADWAQAWQELLRQPWVRPRANERYVTLHDALAEELAQRLIPLHDQTEAWRRRLWAEAAKTYAELTTGGDERLRLDQDRVAQQLLDTPGEPSLVKRRAELDAAKREHDQLKTAQLHYQLLVDFKAGSDLFLEFYQEALDRNDLLFQELICHEFERFLPHGQTAEPLQDALGLVINRFRHWLSTQARRLYLEIGLSIARFLTQNEQSGSALKLLEDLPDLATEPELRYRLANERGNACMRIPDQIRQAYTHFDRALDEASDLSSPNRERRVAQARKEFGFYFRNLGRWSEADEAYRRARDEISLILRPGCPADDREEMASIQTNWAYLKALQGNYEEARNLVESAITVREKLGNTFGLGVSLSVSGEVYRYDHKFTRAWQEYDKAEQIFQELRSVPWLGLVYQEQAICLHQAANEDVVLIDDQVKLAGFLIVQALEICRDRAVRSYPSALNRAGRIFGAQDIEAGLRYLDEAIDEARRVADGWFLSANLIEYLELSYRAWRKTKDSSYRARISRRIPDVERAIDDFHFPDLQARWDLLQGHLIVSDWFDGKSSKDTLDGAVTFYSNGFTALADERVGSHGAAAIGREFTRFRELYSVLPGEVQKKWYGRLRKDWSGQKSTSLVARLEELY